VDPQAISRALLADASLISVNYGSSRHVGTADLPDVSVRLLVKKSHSAANSVRASELAADAGCWRSKPRRARRHIAAERSAQRAGIPAAGQQTRVAPLF